MHHAPRRWRCPDVLQHSGRKCLGSEIERASQVRVKAGPGIHELRMVWELCDREPLRSLHLPGPVKLLLGGIPLTLHFLLGFADLSRNGVLGFLFLTLLLFLLAGRHELQTSAGSWANVRL